MTRNGKHHPPRPRIELRQSPATPEEAAAIAAAIEQFLRDTAPAPAEPGPSMSPWLRAGLFANAGLDPAGPSPWGDPEPWGR
ncbi:MAG: hypothetical protein ACJ77M_18305 [Thermoleophilaceae bacterium]|jgi:hypothetical protein